MPNNNICIYPLIACTYHSLDFYLIVNELIVSPDTDLTQAADELLAYERLAMLSKLVLAKLPQVQVILAELASRTKLNKYIHLSSCPLIIEQKNYGTIIARTPNELELIAYYLSESTIVRLPRATSQSVNFQAQLEEQQLTINSLQEITLIERQSYLSCSLSSPELSCNMYCSSELITRLCNITAISEFNTDCYPAVNQLIQLFNQALSCSLTPVATWRPRFNHLGNYLKILLHVNDIAGYVLIDNWTVLNQKITGATGNKPILYNNLLNLVMPFSLVHGEAVLTLPEVAKLKKGDVVLFDSQLAPEYAKIVFSNLNYKFKLEKNQLIFCDVCS